MIYIYTVTGTMLLLLPHIIKMSNRRTCLPKCSTSENVQGMMLDNCMAGIEVLCCSIGKSRTLSKPKVVGSIPTGITKAYTKCKNCPML